MGSPSSHLDLWYSNFLQSPILLNMYTFVHPLLYCFLCCNPICFGFFPFFLKFPSD
ncbi:uncharacterized protein DS421_11g326910 [Arachis hypogaea]|nr:uncharacterized protein DS421_11g326910 [Arachis hypogaea]